MTQEIDVTARSVLGPLGRYEHSLMTGIRDFQDPHQEWRRLFSEVFGTFLLVMVAAGGGMMSQRYRTGTGEGSRGVCGGGRRSAWHQPGERRSRHRGSGPGD